MSVGKILPKEKVNIVFSLNQMWPTKSALGLHSPIELNHPLQTLHWSMYYH